MRRSRHESLPLSRRAFLRQAGYTAPAFLPAPLRSAMFLGLPRPPLPGPTLGEEAVAEFRLRPAYPNRSPLDEMLRLVAPGADAYITEKHAEELQAWLETLKKVIRQSPISATDFLDAELVATELTTARVEKLGVRSGIELRKVLYGVAVRSGRDAWLPQLRRYFESLGRAETAEFEITSLRQIAAEPTSVDADVRYTLVGARTDGGREQRIGVWRISWQRRSSVKWLATKWDFVEEAVARVDAPLFA